MAQKALTLFFLCFLLIAVIILPQAAAQAEGGGGSPDGNTDNKIPVKPSHSSTAKSKTDSPPSGGGAGMESTNTPTSSSKKVSSNPVNSNTEGNCNEWTYYESCSTDYYDMTVCSEEAIFKSCPSTDYYDYPDPEDHPTDAGTFPPCPPLPNRKLLRAL